MFPFYTPWNNQKIKAFVVFSGGIKWEHWPKISWYRDLLLKTGKLKLKFEIFISSYQEIIRKIDAWERINKRKLDELRATVSKGRTPVLKNRKKNGNTNRASVQEYEKPNVIFTKSSKSMNFGKYAPWNVLKANDLFANKPKIQPIAKQAQLQGNDFC